MVASSISDAGSVHTADPRWIKADRGIVERSLKDRYGAATLFVTVVALLVGYLSLANDTDAWPYGGPSTLWIVAGAAFALVGLVLLLVRYARGALGVWWLAVGLAIVLVGTIVGTAAAFSSDTSEVARGTPTAEITSLDDRQTIDGPVSLSGVVNESLRQGESLWLFVGTLSESGDDPDYFYLQFGPCEEAPDRMTWRCKTVSLANIGPRRVGLYLVAARGDDPAKLVQRLTEGAVFDYQNKNNIPTNKPDSRNAKTLATFGDVVVLDSVIVGLAK
jgi:hypothetical protein